MPLPKSDRRVSTSTQIRNFYSDGMSYLNVKFFNTNLSFQFYPFIAKNANGRNDYDLKHGQQTTVNPEGAFALYQTAKDIIDGKLTECSVSLNCLAGAVLTLERKMNADAQYETIFSINKNSVTIPFKFQTIERQVTKNGIPMTEQLEIGLGSFMMTIQGYLDGINANRHLDKMTEDYANQRQDYKTRFGGTGPNGPQYTGAGIGYQPTSQSYPPAPAAPWNATPVSSYQLPV